MHDVLILGGGPAGSTTAALLKKYMPSLSVLVVERERFPRDHIGESQLPPISALLDEMGCWDKVERGGFPVKIGGTFTWGQTTEPWVFAFLPDEAVPEISKVVRPGKYEGWRRDTAFQVDRSVYDKILLDHAESLGCETRYGERVAKVHRTADRVDGIELEGGEVLRARWYVDATGNAAVIRRAMDVGVDIPTPLKNIAFWDYWENPAWASEDDAVVTRVHIRSLPYGWVWYIRLGATRASIGLVCNAEWYKRQGTPYHELYHRAIREEKDVAKRIPGARSRERIEATNDWSYVVDRTCGENWFLVGECAGFADPILTAGLTLTQTGARELAYALLEVERGDLPRDWVVGRYDELQRRRVRQHMRFAEFWYSANGIFEDIRVYCSEIARESGFEMTPAAAFRWLAQGGLGDDMPGQVGLGGLDVSGVKQVMKFFTGQAVRWTVDGKNVFKLDLLGAEQGWDGGLQEGRIVRSPCWVRNGKRLPCVGLQGTMVEILKRHSDVEKILEAVRASALASVGPEHVELVVHHAIQVLEVLVNNRWVKAGVKKHRPVLGVDTPAEGQIIHHLDFGSKKLRVGRL